MTAGALIQLKRGKQTTTTNPVLAVGEPWVELDNSGLPTGKMKVGDGVSHVNSLPYFTPGSGTYAPLVSPALTGAPTVNGAQVEDRTHAAATYGLVTDVVKKVSKGELILYAKDWGVVADGVADDSNAMDALRDEYKRTGMPIWLGPGDIRLTRTFLYQTTGDADGLKMAGAGWFRTRFLMDFADGTPGIKLDGASLQLYKFQWYGYLTGFQIRPAVGRTTVRSQGGGLSLTGVFGLEVDLFINGVHGDGVISPNRDDLSPNNGDPYATVYVDFKSTRIENCDGIGVNGAAGIGFSSIKFPRCRIGKNRQGGMVLGGHNIQVHDICSVFSNGYDADLYINGNIAANGTTVTASTNVLSDTAPPFTSADIGKKVTGSVAGRVPAGATIASINSTTSFELSAAGTPGSVGIYVQRTGLVYPGIWVKKINGNTTGTRIGQCELDGNKVANVKWEGCSSGAMFSPRFISHETTFNDGELSPPVHCQFATVVSGAKNTNIEIFTPYHRSEDTGAGRTLTLYDLGNSTNVTDIGIHRASVPPTDNVPVAQITQLANKNNTTRLEATINSKMVSSDQKLPQLDYRWTSGRTDTGCTTTNGSTTVGDASALAVDAGKSITGTGIPANATITAVTAGVGYTISAAATADGTGLSLVVGGTISSTTNTVISFNSVSLDQDGLYANGVFTAPYRGLFDFTVVVTPTSPTAGRRFRFYLNKATPPGAYGIAQQATRFAQGSGSETLEWTTSLLLAAGDTVTIGADQNSGTPHATNLNTTETKLSIRGV